MSDDRALDGAIIVVGLIVVYLIFFIWCQRSTDLTPVPQDTVEESQLP